MRAAGLWASRWMGVGVFLWPMTWATLCGAFRSGVNPTRIAIESLIALHVLDLSRT